MEGKQCTATSSRAVPSANPVISTLVSHHKPRPVDSEDLNTRNTTMMIPDTENQHPCIQIDNPGASQLVEVKTWDKHRHNPNAEVVLVSKDKIGFRVEAWYIEKHR